MLALVTGGNGFIGSGLVDWLRAVGHRVRVLDQSAPRGDVDWRDIDYATDGLADVSRLEALQDGVEVVFHLASSTVPSTSNLNPVADLQSNLFGALNLCRAMINAGTRRLVFFSSGEPSTAIRGSCRCRKRTRFIRSRPTASSRWRSRPTC